MLLHNKYASLTKNTYTKTKILLVFQVDCSTLSFVRDKVPVFCEKRGVRDQAGLQRGLQVGGRAGVSGHCRGPGALHQEEGQGDLSVQQRQV